MNPLLGYRSNLVGELEAAAGDFRRACLAIKDPFQAVDEGGWNTHQLAVHTRDVDVMVYGLRIRRTAQENQPVFEDFDGDAWMKEHYDPDQPLASILDELSASVKETAAMLRELPPESWGRLSSHEVYGGGFTLQTWVERSLAHLREHLETVQKATKFQ